MIGATHFFADGLKQLQAGAVQEALTALSVAIQLDPEFGEAYAYRGLAEYQLGDYDTAMQDPHPQLSPIAASFLNSAPCFSSFLATVPTGTNWLDPVWT